MSSNTLSIVWFRQDLRITDNPALTAAAEAGKVLPVYILDDVNAGNWAMGAASRAWLHHSLEKLNRELDGKLMVFSGDARAIIDHLADSLPLKSVSVARESREPAIYLLWVMLRLSQG